MCILDAYNSNYISPGDSNKPYYPSITNGMVLAFLWSHLPLP